MMKKILTTLFLVMILAIGALNAACSSPLPQVSVATQPVPKTATPSAPVTPTLGAGSKTVSAKDGMTLVYVPAGEFLMGSVDEQLVLAKKSCPDCNFAAEQPQHKVYLDAYWIDQTEVTNGMYAQCVQAGECQPPHQTRSVARSSYYGNTQYDNYPVIRVDWTQAMTYCQWAGRRLPTEAEWEKAARGTDGRFYPWGNQGPADRLLNYKAAKGDTTAVGSYPDGASPFGALDMAGNVWEWVYDWYDENYYSASPSNNPPGPTTGDARLLRGGAWDSIANMIRSAYRVKSDPIQWDENLGFRCAQN